MGEPEAAAAKEPRLFVPFAVGMLVGGLVGLFVGYLAGACDVRDTMIKAAVNAGVASYGMDPRTGVLEFQYLKPGK